MARIAESQIDGVRLTWPTWLNSLVSEGRWTDYRFANLINNADVNDGTKASLPPSRVKEWREGRSLPSLKTAFRIGEALRDLPVGWGPLGRRKEWASGPIALYAAGYLADCVGFLVRMIALGAENYAVGLIASIPVLVIGSTLTQKQRVALEKLYRNPIELDVIQNVARTTALIHTEKSGSFFRYAWANWLQKRSPLGAPSQYLKTALDVSATRLPFGIRARIAWDLLDAWAMAEHEESYTMPRRQLLSAWRELQLVEAIPTLPRIGDGR